MPGFCLRRSVHRNARKNQTDRPHHLLPSRHRAQLRGVSRKGAPSSIKEQGLDSVPASHGIQASSAVRNCSSKSRLSPCSARPPRRAMRRAALFLLFLAPLAGPAQRGRSLHPPVRLRWISAQSREHWIEPILDSRVLPAEADPSERAALRQSVRLALVAALQNLALKATRRSADDGGFGVFRS
jgi:hypothetical protein